MDREPSTEGQPAPKFKWATTRVSPDLYDNFEAFAKARDSNIARELRIAMRKRLHDAEARELEEAL